MSQSDDSPWLRHHRQRWLRHDAHLWIRPDAARFFPPGTDLAVINPTPPCKPDAAKAAAFQAELAAEVERTRQSVSHQAGRPAHGYRESFGLYRKNCSVR
jgi:ABC-type Zn2+ transport system substrate-binding protein/surface adhesin